MAKECLICGKSMGTFTGKVAISGGHSCMECWEKTGFDNSMNALVAGAQYDADTLVKIISTREENAITIQNFKPSATIGNISFDDNSKSFVIRKSKNNADLYCYNQIVDFELLEDGESIAKGGLGCAVAGGIGTISTSRITCR